MYVGRTRNLYCKSIRFVAGACLVGYICLLTSCVEPPSGTIEELIKVDPPTFSGSISKVFTTSTPQYVLRGECDTRSLGIEYSFDETTWIQISGGCGSGQFTISLTTTSFKKVFVRAQTKMGFTATSSAIVRFANPPTTGVYQTVVAGNSIEETQGGIRFTMGHAFSGEKVASPNFNLNTNVTGVVYGTP